MQESQAITQFAIYPSIGVARVGNSPAGVFFGPEQPGELRRGPYRDDGGRIKRQAARFRVYGLDAAGRVVKEITAADGRIEWRVDVANTKAAWFDFDLALDIPESMGSNTTSGIASLIRNPDVKGAERASLAITPRPVAISGRGVNEGGGDGAYELSGKFVGRDVYLGEVRTDEAGRLVFLGGRGVSASADGKALTTFANNAGWHDDVSDGPVDATVEYDGRTYQATGAWVVVGPPDYAPGVQGIVTGYDLLFDVAAHHDPELLPARPSFAQDVYPLLRRFSQHQWVNAGFARDFGFGTPADFADPAFVARLGDRSEATRTLRASIFGWFRDPSYQVPQPTSLPAYYGDGMTTSTTSTDPRQWMAIVPTQYRWLAQWAAGDFEADGPAKPAPPWESLSAAEQVAGIDRAVLDEVLGGPFHPGAEFTWPMRNQILYASPFRIKRRTAPAPSFGTQLVGSVALAVGGPLDGSAAGDVTRWMAVPWQADTSSCLSGYITYVDDYLPTFWPARVPNDVLSSEQYAVVMDPLAPIGEKEHELGFHRRVKWLRGIRYPMKPETPPKIWPSQPAINKFLDEWWKVGIIEVKPGPGAPLPSELWVETGRQIETDQPLGTPLLRLTDED
jgi:hypothetical protein